MTRSITREQRSILLVCIICYTTAYMGRLNLAAALSRLSLDLALSTAKSGAFQTVFALTYATGQILFGSMVDRVSARKFISLALLLSGLCNVLFSLADSYFLLVLLWAANGAAQSMLWTPIVKLITAWFQSPTRERAGFLLSMTVTLGHLAAWALSGFFANILSWRLAFTTPALLLVGMSVLARLRLRDWPRASEAPDEDARVVTDRPMAQSPQPLPALFRGTGLMMILACAVCSGFVRDGITAWAPSILSSLGEGQALNTTLLSLMIPLINLLGILLVQRFFNRMQGKTRLVTALIMLLNGALAASLLGSGHSLMLLALLMGLGSATNNGVNPLLTTMVPMEYEGMGRVGLVAGLINSFIYLGSALTGVVTGALSEALGWQGVYVAWALVAALGGLFAFLSIRGRKRLPA